MKKLLLTLLLMLVLPGCTMAPNRAMVSFTFDDGYDSVYTAAFPMLSQFGFPGVAYMVSGNLKRARRLTAAQLNEMQSAGWEIGSHSITHPKLTDLNNEELYREVVTSKSELQEAGLFITTFAPPGGAYDGRVEALARSHYASMRSTSEGFNFAPADSYNLLVKATFNWTKTGDVKKWLREAKQKEAWLILVFHHIDDTGSTYSMKPETLHRILAYTKKQKIPVVTISEGLRLINKE